MRMVAVVGSRTYTGAEAKAVVLEASRALTARQSRDQMRIERARLVRRAHHIELEAERDSVRRAVMAVEHRLVEALWVLARLPASGARGFSSKNGISYLLDHVDQYANAVANGGEWDRPSPKPAVPSAKSIDAMYDPLEWLSWLGRIEGKLVAAAASSKRGQVNGNVRWRWVKSQVPELEDVAIRTLQWRYTTALHNLVTELTIRKAESRA